MADQLNFLMAAGQVPPTDPHAGAADWTVPGALGVVEQAAPANAPLIGPQAGGMDPLHHGEPAAHGAQGLAVPSPIDDADHHFPVPHIREAVATVRRRAHTLLNDWDLPPDCLDDALVVISELITNAILHALPPAVLRLRRTGTEGCPTLYIEVSDGGPVPREEPVEEEGEPCEHGRGIGIVSALSACHGTEVDRAGVTHWAELPVD